MLNPQDAALSEIVKLVLGTISTLTVIKNPIIKKDETINDELCRDATYQPYTDEQLQEFCEKSNEIRLVYGDNIFSIALKKLKQINRNHGDKINRSAITLGIASSGYTLFAPLIVALCCGLAFAGTILGTLLMAAMFAGTMIYANIDLHKKYSRHQLFIFLSEKIIDEISKSFAGNVTLTTHHHRHKTEVEVV